jgi:hypothetical protein
MGPKLKSKSGSQPLLKVVVDPPQTPRVNPQNGPLHTPLTQQEVQNSSVGGQIANTTQFNASPSEVNEEVDYVEESIPNDPDQRNEIALSTFVENPLVRRQIVKCNELRSTVMASVRHDRAMCKLTRFFLWDDNSISAAVTNENDFPTPILMDVVSNHLIEEIDPHDLPFHERRAKNINAIDDESVTSTIRLATQGPFILTQSPHRWTHHYRFLVCKYLLIMRVFLKENEHDRTSALPAFALWRAFCGRFKFPSIFLCKKLIETPVN